MRKTEPYSPRRRAELAWRQLVWGVLSTHNGGSYEDHVRGAELIQVPESRGWGKNVRGSICLPKKKGAEEKSSCFDWSS